jgi:hypothetical protein
MEMVVVSTVRLREDTLVQEEATIQELQTHAPRFVVTGSNLEPTHVMMEIT